MGWTCNFKSRNDTNCRILINGGGTSVTGAASPVVIEENDSDDLLDVLRYKTGYISLVETTQGELDALVPTTNTSHTVEIYYGSELIFFGFIQAQTFENSWVPSPRVISFPIISPLGLLENINMPTYNPPQAVTLAELLADVVDELTTLGALYTNVIFPNMSVGLDSTISSLVVCPFNSEHTAAIVSAGLWSPISCAEFVEGLCNAFGWMVHETGSELVFTKFDHTDGYKIVATSNLRSYTGVTDITYTGATVQSLTTRCTPADDDGKISTVMPVEEIELSYDGEYVENTSFDFAHLTYNSQTVNGNQYVAWLRSATPEVTGNALLVTNYFNNGKLTAEGINPCSCGTSLSQKECFLVNLPNSAHFSGELFTVKFYDRPTGNGFKVVYNMRWGNMILNLGNDNTVAHKLLGIKVKVGSQWYHGNGVWSTTEANEYNYGIDGEYYWEVTNAPEGLPVEVSFYQYYTQVTDPVQTLTVEDLRLEELPVVYSDYMVTKGKTDKIRVAGGTGQGTANISMLFSTYRKNSNMIGSATTSRFTNYTYMMVTQYSLKVRFKKLAALPYWMYVVYMSFFSSSWRVISISHDPWNDECILVLQRSLQ